MLTKALHSYTTKGFTRSNFKAYLLPHDSTGCHTTRNHVIIAERLKVFKHICSALSVLLNLAYYIHSAVEFVEVAKWGL